MRNLDRAVFAACAMALAAPAHALDLSPQRGGDAILLPYYSTQAGDATVLEVVNHSDAVKAVRVVIAEGRNGRVALSFNLYLAQRDSWSAALVGDAGSPPATPRLISSDETCTSAPIPPEGVPLRVNAFSGNNDDHLGHEVGRLSRGQVEVIEMGVLSGEAAALATARDCELLRGRFAAGAAWAADPNAGVSTPTGSLSANAHLVNVERGIAYDIESFAFAGFSGAARHGRGDDDYQAVRIFKPTLPPGATEFMVGAARIAGSQPADAVSLLLMNSRLEAPFALQDSIAAHTQVVLAFPTRPAYVDNASGGELPANAPVRAPFTQADLLPTWPHVESTTWDVIDRSGVVHASEEVELIEQTNTIDLGTQFDTAGADAGRIRIGLHPESHALNYSSGPGQSNTFANGLPVVAFTLIEAVNANAQPGLLANYALTGRAVGELESFVDF